MNWKKQVLLDQYAVKLVINLSSTPAEGGAGQDGSWTELVFPVTALEAHFTMVQQRKETDT